MKNSPDRLHELLAARRDQIPGDDYFRTVLPEFHRRLRQQTVQSTCRTSLVDRIWESFHEAVLPGLSPAWRMAGAACALTLALYIAFHPAIGGNATQQRLLTLETPSLSQPGAKYSLSEAGDLDLTTKVDQQLDRVSLTDVRSLQTNYLAEETTAHYVLTNHPVTYDTVAAF